MALDDDDDDDNHVASVSNSTQQSLNGLLITLSSRQICFHHERALSEWY